MGVGQAVVEFLAGGVGGVACVLGGQPLDTVKVKLQAFPGNYKSSYDCIWRTYRHGGLVSFYAGSSPAFMTSLIENAFLLATYDSCLDAIRWISGKKESEHVPLFLHACAGSVASVPATFTCAPVDRIKSVMQVQRELSTGHLVRQRRYENCFVVLFSNVGDGKFMNNLRFFYFSLTLDRKLKFIYSEWLTNRVNQAYALSC